MANAQGATSELRSFSYQDLVLMTDSFSEKKLLVVGYRWKLYRGEISEKMDCGEARDVTVKIWDDSLEEDAGYFEDELKFLTCCRHQNIVKLYGLCRGEGVIGFVYDFTSVIFFRWPLRVKVALAVANAITFLHSQDSPFILRNLEPRLLLLDKDFNAKLFDFGLGSGGVFGDRTSTYADIFSSDAYNYLHAEHNGSWSTKTDMFDFGIVLFTLLVMRPVVHPTIHELVELGESVCEGKKRAISNNSGLWGYRLYSDDSQIRRSSCAVCEPFS
ncbi:hypothetical protein GIB67_002878 [Kingdonia uniflora]|uniref:Protein kinase domain-containing protein n=1 Tax=Kingdonia uniflora TaxID=39325 RepID=A0A7J7NQC2_9MAGN|nr:hypothetical protein GIB67_002878 [Kingdonia uniflora]